VAAVETAYRKDQDVLGQKAALSATSPDRAGVGLGIGSVTGCVNGRRMSGRAEQVQTLSETQPEVRLYPRIEQAGTGAPARPAALDVVTSQLPVAQGHAHIADPHRANATV